MSYRISRACRPMLIAVSAVIAVGCTGNIKPPQSELSKAELAVNQAADSQAPQVEPVEFRKAREKLDEAKAAMNLEKYEEARRLAEQALVDAQLAEARAQAADARRAAEELRETIEKLRQEAERLSRG